MATMRPYNYAGGTLYTTTTYPGHKGHAMYYSGYYKQCGWGALFYNNTGKDIIITKIHTLVSSNNGTFTAKFGYANIGTSIANIASFKPIGSEFNVTNYGGNITGWTSTIESDMFTVSKNHYFIVGIRTINMSSNSQYFNIARTNNNNNKNCYYIEYSGDFTRVTDTWKSQTPEIYIEYKDASQPTYINGKQSETLEFWQGDSVSFTLSGYSSTRNITAPTGFNITNNEKPKHIVTSDPTTTDKTATVPINGNNSSSTLYLKSKHPYFNSFTASVYTLRPGQSATLSETHAGSSSLTYNDFDVPTTNGLNLNNLYVVTQNPSTGETSEPIFTDGVETTITANIKKNGSSIISGLSKTLKIKSLHWTPQDINVMFSRYKLLNDGTDEIIITNNTNLLNISDNSFNKIKITYTGIDRGLTISATELNLGESATIKSKAAGTYKIIITLVNDCTVTTEIDIEVIRKINFNLIYPRSSIETIGLYDESRPAASEPEPVEDYLIKETLPLYAFEVNPLDNNSGYIIPANYPIKIQLPTLVYDNRHYELSAKLYFGSYTEDLYSQEPIYQRTFVPVTNKILLDFVAVVNTYAELQAYDTSLLKNNDIIKVLRDSTHGGALAYYRWVINSSTHVGAWSYVPYSIDAEFTNEDSTAESAEVRTIILNLKKIIELNINFNKAFGNRTAAGPGSLLYNAIFSERLVLYYDEYEGNTFIQQNSQSFILNFNIYNLPNSKNSRFGELIEYRPAAINNIDIIVNEYSDLPTMGNIQNNTIAKVINFNGHVAYFYSKRDSEDPLIIFWIPFETDLLDNTIERSLLDAQRLNYLYGRIQTEPEYLVVNTVQTYLDLPSSPDISSGYITKVITDSHFNNQPGYYYCYNNRWINVNINHNDSISWAMRENFFNITINPSAETVVPNFGDGKLISQSQYKIENLLSGIYDIIDKLKNSPECKSDQLLKDKLLLPRKYIASGCPICWDDSNPNSLQKISNAYNNGNNIRHIKVELTARYVPNTGSNNILSIELGVMRRDLSWITYTSDEINSSDDYKTMYYEFDLTNDELLGNFNPFIYLKCEFKAFRDALWIKQFDVHIDNVRCIINPDVDFSTIPMGWNSTGVMLGIYSESGVRIASIFSFSGDTPTGNIYQQLNSITVDEYLQESTASPIVELLKSVKSFQSYYEQIGIIYNNKPVTFNGKNINYNLYY